MNKKFLVVLCVLINAIYMNAKAENFDYKVISEEKEIKIIADEKYETAPKRNNNQYDSEELLNEAVKYIANEQVDKACDMFERMIDKYPNDAWLMCKLAYIYEGYANDKDMTKKYYDRAYEVDPDYPEALYQHGLKCYSDGEKSGAINSFQKLVDQIERLYGEELQYALDAAEEIVELGLTDLKYDGIDSVLEKLENCNINDRDVVKRIVYAYDVEIYIKYIKRDVSIKETGKRYDNFLKRTSLNENEIQTLMMEMGHLSFHKTIKCVMSEIK